MKEDKQTEIYDAIVIGTGISGGWTAKELCEQGSKQVGTGILNYISVPSAFEACIPVIDGGNISSI